MKVKKRAIEIEKIVRKLESSQNKTFLSTRKIIQYVNKSLAYGHPISLVNIICPGYQKDRTVGVEDFAFKRLSYDISECPNVLSMIDKLDRYTFKLTKLAPELKIDVTIIFADTAILNYDELEKVQNVRKSLDIFAKTAIEYIRRLSNKNPHLANFKFIKMSQMRGEFRKLNIEGYKVTMGIEEMTKVRREVKIKTKQYIKELTQDRISSINKFSTFENMTKEEVKERTKLEVLRFLNEYGLAGKEIYTSIPRSILTFTEPSGSMRGYLYNAFLFEKDYLPVIYLP